MVVAPAVPQSGPKALQATPDCSSLPADAPLSGEFAWVHIQ